MLIIRYALIKIKYNIIGTIYRKTIRNFLKTKWSFFSSQKQGKILNSFTITDAEYITFCVKENLLSIKSDGSTSKLDMDFKKTESFVKSKKLKINSKNEKSVEEQEEIRYKLNKCEGNFNASFGISLLKKMNKTNTIVDSLQCNLSPDMPIRFDYKLSKNSNINFYLSPKYEVD